MGVSYSAINPEARIAVDLGTGGGLWRRMGVHLDQRPGTVQVDVWEERATRPRSKLLPEIQDVDLERAGESFALAVLAAKAKWPGPWCWWHDFYSGSPYYYRPLQGTSTLCVRDSWRVVVPRFPEGRAVEFVPALYAEADRFETRGRPAPGPGRMPRRA